MTDQESSGLLQRAAEEEKSRIMQEVKRQLIQLRKLQNMTQREIGDATGMRTSNITRIERDDYDPSLEILLRYASALGLTLNISVVDRATGEKVTAPAEVEVSDDRFVLDQQEKRLLAYYRKLGRGEKRMVCRMAKDLNTVSERSDRRKNGS